MTNLLSRYLQETIAVSRFLMKEVGDTINLDPAFWELFKMVWMERIQII